MTWLLLLCAIVSEVAATLSLKAAVTTPTLYIVVVGGYLASFVFLALVLKRGMGLGVAYGIWGAIGVALTALLSSIIFGAAFTVVMGVGMVFIIGGVLLVEMGSHRADDTADDAAAGAP